MEQGKKEILDFSVLHLTSHAVPSVLSISEDCLGNCLQGKTSFRKNSGSHKIYPGVVNVVKSLVAERKTGRILTHLPKPPTPSVAILSKSINPSPASLCLQICFLVVLFTFPHTTQQSEVCKEVFVDFLSYFSPILSLLSEAVRLLTIHVGVTKHHKFTSHSPVECEPSQEV